MKLRTPRVMLAGERSGVGKSTITVGILAALRKRGYAVQPFKAGPDYLDPMHHNVVVDRISRNLDTWMFPEYVPRSFWKASMGADISVIEGAMGFYDGYDGVSEEGSAAHLSKVLRCPVILVLDAAASARSLGAVAKGFAEYDADVDIAGVIFNCVAGERHLRMLEASLRGIECLGGLPKDPGMALESRHLGLVPAREAYDAKRYATILKVVEEHLDIDRIIEIAQKAEGLELPEDEERPQLPARCRIGVAMDEAFNFYYQDNLDILRDLGAEIVPFSPMRDHLPEVDGLYFGGGYPEVFAPQLAQNTKILRQVKEAAEEEMPIYAECGGLMYLCASLRAIDGNVHQMTRIFDAEVHMTSKLQAIGYVEARVLKDNVMSKKGWSSRGHVFHYSHVTGAGSTDFAYDLHKEKGIAGAKDGLAMKNTLASYTHLHFGSCPRFAERFVQACESRTHR